MRYICAFLIFIVAIGAAGCRTLRSPASPYSAWDPPKWEKSWKEPDEVWKAIRERVVDTSKPLALIELVAIAVSNNPTTRQAWEETRVAEAQGMQTKKDLYPKVTGTADITYQRLLSTRKQNNLNDITYGPEASFTYILLDFGGKGAAVREATQTILAANFAFNQSFQDLLLDVETSYYGLYSAQSELEAAYADVANALEAYNIAQQQFNVGLVAMLDVLQAKSDYDDSLYRLEEAKGNVKTAEADLAQTLGLSADTKFEIAPPSVDFPQDIVEVDMRRLIDRALARRPDISSQRATLRAKEAAVQSAASDLAPKLSGGGGVGANWYDYYTDGTDTARDWSYTGFFKVDWDVFDISLYGAKRQAEAEARAEREALAQSELAASADVWTKFYAYRTAVKKLTFSKAFLETARNSYDLALQSYKAGIKSILDLLQAQSKLSEARSKLIQSEKDLYVAIADLAHATGTLYAESYGLAMAEGKETRK